MSAIRPRHTPSLGHGGPNQTLNVRHPHYLDYNILIKLPALDDGNTVDYNVALVVCGIIADNSWSTGWFARSVDGSNKCNPGEPLTADVSIFYFVGDANYKYPICISWDHWRIPLETDLPSAFSSLPIEDAPLTLEDGGYMEDLKARDKSCRVSGTVDFCENAHLVPASETAWWDSNMGQSSDLQIHSAGNGMRLRADLHRSIDSGTWVPMVREGRLVVYVVRTTAVSKQFAALWHNVEMQALVGVDRRCLFARVAWAVLSLHHRFLASRRLASDNLLVRMKDGEKEMAPKAFDQFSRSRSRNPSPTKRPRFEALEEDRGVIVAAELRWGEDDTTAADHDESELDGEDKKRRFCDVDDDSVMYRRGRKRHRSPIPLPSPLDLELDHGYIVQSPPKTKK